MAKKRSVANAVSVGEKLATEVLQRRKAAQATRRAAVEAKGAAWQAKSASASVRAGLSVGILVAEGDSWFDYPMNDVLKNLYDDYGYDIESVARAGDRVEDMAYSDGQLDHFARRVENVLERGDVPTAILLSGGGNDITGKVELGMLLNHARSGISGLNRKVVEGVINERLFEALTTILVAVTAVCERYAGKPIPIVVHGYDYPVPDGRGVGGGFWFLPGPWLEPGFRLKGYEVMDERIALVKDLIDQFNAMLISVVEYAKFPHVHYLDLRGTLSSGPDYKKWWANELHPKKKGFAAVTAKFAATIESL